MAGGRAETTVGHGHSPDHPIAFTREFWDERYQSAGQLWSGQPNPQLAAQTAELAPGAALDAGCGEGADAIWLASRGWTVTGVDVSAVALDRAAGYAAAAGEQIAGRITWRREDLRSWTPEPARFDLVSAQFMFLPPAEQASLYERLAAAVRPGGTLLVVTHHADDLHANVGRTGEPDMFLSAEQLAGALARGDWDVLVAEARDRSAKDVDGQPTTVRDTVLRAARRP
jgi:SAM-dependent methyltransferase